MPLDISTNDAEHHSIGMAGSSKHQGWIWHMPPGASPDSPGYGASRLDRVPIQQQLTGHTAVYSRVNGTISFARGFVPDKLSLLPAFVSSAGGWGHWQTDFAMLKDPTCNGFEVRVSRQHAASVIDYFNSHTGAIITYALTGSNAGIGKDATFNCVVAAGTVMINYLLDVDPEGARYAGAVEQILANIKSTRQADVMRWLNAQSGKPLRSKL